MKHMQYYDKNGYLDHGRYLKAIVGEFIHPFQNSSGEVNWKVLQVDDIDENVIKVMVEVYPVHN